MNNFFKNADSKTIKNLSNELCNLSPTEFITLGCITAIILTQYLDPNEQNTIGNFLEMVGQILLTSYAQASTVNPNYMIFSATQGKKLQDTINYILNKINSTN